MWVCVDSARLNASTQSFLKVTVSLSLDLRTVSSVAAIMNGLSCVAMTSLGPSKPRYLRIAGSRIAAVMRASESASHLRLALVTEPSSPASSQVSSMLGPSSINNDVIGMSARNFNSAGPSCSGELKGSALAISSYVSCSVWVSTLLAALSNVAFKCAASAAIDANAPAAVKPSMVSHHLLLVN